MGNFITQLESEMTEQHKQLTMSPHLKNSLSKLREYHGAFKSVCDTFAIDNSEFE
jgi:hypothetical protein